MKKEQGVTMIELMVAIALMAILVSMINPIMKSVSTAHKKEETINKIDDSIGKSIDIIKREVRGTRPANIKVSGAGKILKLVQPDRTIKFTIDTSSFPGFIKVGAKNKDKIATNLKNGSFRYEENVLVIYLQIEVDGVIKEIRDAAVTRLRFN